MEIYPVKLQLVEPASLLIEWSDGRKQQFSHAELRSHCPCATCREKHAPGSPEPAAAPPPDQAVRVVSMKPAGNYAYCIALSDGHDSGIYTFEQLRGLGHEVLNA
ncbi:MAG: DUF971 domain-containing protein [Candidatus Anammoximicrobium sp.]|nr:DUF971 domain-containing protein [Candidatus Anammoximicrobium sp.]